MTPADLRQAIASGDEQAARRSVWACGELLRDGRSPHAGELVSVLVAVASSPSAVVRQAVADASDAFDEAAFDQVHARFLADADSYVRAAAAAAAHRRVRGRKKRSTPPATDGALAAILGEIEKTKDGRAARKLAERAVDLAVEHFAERLDHEVRKSKDPIHLSLATLIAEIESPERSATRVRQHVAALRERCAFAFAVVRRARDYAARPKPVFADASLAEVVEEARAQLVDRSGERGGKIAFRVDVNPALRMDLDRHALLQALQNVLQNAVEAYPASVERPAVRIAARPLRDGSEVELTVSDDGMGIAEDRMASIFVPFGSRKPGGTGVGMAIVRRMIEEVHGGELTLASALNRGTTVRMVLPVKQGRR